MLAPPRASQVSLSEFKGALQALKLDLDDDKYTTIFQEWDFNKNGFLDFHEIHTVIHGREQRERRRTGEHDDTSVTPPSKRASPYVETRPQPSPGRATSDATDGAPAVTAGAAAAAAAVTAGDAAAPPQRSRPPPPSSHGGRHVSSSGGRARTPGSNGHGNGLLPPPSPSSPWEPWEGSGAPPQAIVVKQGGCSCWAALLVPLLILLAAYALMGGTLASPAPPPPSSSSLELTATAADVIEVGSGAKPAMAPPPGSPPSQPSEVLDAAWVLPLVLLAFAMPMAAAICTNKRVGGGGGTDDFATGNSGSSANPAPRKQVDTRPCAVLVTASSEGGGGGGVIGPSTTSIAASDTREVHLVAGGANSFSGLLALEPRARLMSDLDDVDASARRKLRPSSVLL